MRRFILWARCALTHHKLVVALNFEHAWSCRCGSNVEPYIYSFAQRGWDAQDS